MFSLTHNHQILFPYFRTFGFHFARKCWKVFLMYFEYLRFCWVICDYPQRYLSFLLTVITDSKICSIFLRVIVHLFFEESLSLHPFLIHLLWWLTGPLPRIYILKLIITGFLIHKIRTHKLKLIRRLITFNTFFVIIIPYCTFKILINSNKWIMSIKVYTDYCCCVVIEKLTKLMDLCVLCYLFWFIFYYIFLL